MTQPVLDIQQLHFCLPPLGLISLVMVFAICLTRKQEESSHDPTRSGHSTTAFEFPRF